VEKSQFLAQMHIKMAFSIPERGQMLSKQAVQKVCVGNIQHAYILFMTSYLSQFYKYM